MSEPRARRAASPFRRPAGGALAHGRLRGWNAAVAISAVVFVIAGLALGAGWCFSVQSRPTTFASSGPDKQFSFQLVSGNATIVVSPSATVEVRRTDRYAFGHPA